MWQVATAYIGMLQYTYDPKRFFDLLFRRVPLIILMTLYKSNSKGPSIKYIGNGKGSNIGRKLVNKWSKLPTKEVGSKIWKKKPTSFMDGSKEINNLHRSVLVFITSSIGDFKGGTFQD